MAVAGLAPSTGRVIDAIVEREDNTTVEWAIVAVKILWHPEALAEFYRETR